MNQLALCPLSLSFAKFNIDSMLTKTTVLLTERYQALLPKSRYAYIIKEILDRIIPETHLG